MELSEQQWRAKLSPDQYRVLRQKGTETPFTGELLNERREGMLLAPAVAKSCLKAIISLNPVMVGQVFTMSLVRTPSNLKMILRMACTVSK